jgi:Xaa-Pro aminopeptidase
MSESDFLSTRAPRALMVDRQARLREVMRARDVPVLLVTDPINIQYASGARNMTVFSTRTPARYLLQFAEGPSILYEYFGCEHLAQCLPTLDAVRPARGLCHVSAGGDAPAQAAAMAVEVAAAVRDAGLKVERLAVDRFPFAAIDALRAVGFRLLDADPVFARARQSKLPGEVALMREALRRVAAAAAEMEARIEPGRRETEIWADFQHPFLASEGEYVVTRLLQSGARTFPYFQEAGGRKLEAGDLLCFDTDTVGFAGYCTDFSRTYLCGDRPASAGQRDLYAKAKEQLDWNSALIEPGAAFRDIAESAWPIPPEHRKSRYYCIGHGLGMSGEFPNIPHAVAGEPYPISGVVEPGMVICIESYVGSEEMGCGVKLEDQLLVTESGVERMSAEVPFDARLLARSI